MLKVNVVFHCSNRSVGYEKPHMLVWAGAEELVVCILGRVSEMEVRGQGRKVSLKGTCKWQHER